MSNADVLQIDAPAAIERIAGHIRREVLAEHRRRGAIVAISGGIDSSVVAALCAHALGPSRVLGILMPEVDSSDTALRLGTELARALGIEAVVEPIGSTLEALGCYRRQREALVSLVPEYTEGWRWKLVLPTLLGGDRLSIARVVVADPTGRTVTVRPSPEIYRQLVAATNMKQRTRKLMEYYHSDRLHRVVAGTPNRLEYELGFFVKQGDGAADIKPIAHLFKSQVYALGAELGVPAEILGRTPTTDTFSLEQTQEEFYFSLPYRSMDLCLWAHDHALSIPEAAGLTGLTEEQAGAAYRDIEAKRRLARYLHHVPAPYPQEPGA